MIPRISPHFVLTNLRSATVSAKRAPLALKRPENIRNPLIFLTKMATCSCFAGCKALVSSYTVKENIIMIYLESPSTDAEWNLALEQYVFDEMDRSQSYFMLWQNANAIIIGKNQNTIEEINQEFVREHDIQVVRRLSGGGAVYHDLGNLNFTYIVDGESDSNMDMRVFCEPIARALRQLGVEAEVNGRNDITIDGQKFSGNSQYIRDHRIMHHGTLMFDSDLSMLSNCLRVSKDKIESRGIKSVRSRVTNISDHLAQDITLQDFKETLLRFMSEEETLVWQPLTQKDLNRVEEIRQQRYGTWEWNYGYSPEYHVTREQRVDGCGRVTVSMEIREGLITEMAFYGDYFGNGDTSDLALALTGCPARAEDLLERLRGTDVQYYINHLSAEQLADIIAGDMEESG